MTWMPRLAGVLSAAVLIAPGALAADDSAGGFMGGLKYSLNDPVTHTAFLALVVFVLISWRMGAFKAVFGGLDSRADAIRAELEEAQSLREQAAEALALAERRQQDADKEAEATIAQAKEDAKTMMESARKDMAEKLVRREALAEARIARAEADAADEVRRAAADAATEAARRILEKDEATNQFERAAKDIERALS
jgi:F-type H+-transporting ATPase subunit b